MTVGAGEAGARAATAQGETAWTGSVTLIGAVPGPPHERPPLLSKMTITDQGDPAPPRPPPIFDVPRMADRAAIVDPHVPLKPLKALLKG